MSKKNDKLSVDVAGKLKDQNQIFTYDYCKDGSIWDNFLIKCLHGYHEQCSQYAANRVEHGYQCDRIIIQKNNDIVGGVQVLVQATPLGKFARIFRGPVTINDDPDIMRLIVQQLEKHAKEHSYASVRIDLFPNQNVAYLALIDEGFLPSLAWYREKSSHIVPLSLPIEELAKKMDKNVRYSVRLATRKGVTVEVGVTDGSSIDSFYDMHEATASHQGFPVFSREYFSYIWNLFGSIGKAQLFIANYNGEPCAAIFNLIVGDQMYYTWGGMLRDTNLKNLRVNYILHMTALSWAQENGCSRYDLSGDQMFKKQFAIETIVWPRPLRKFYGTTRFIRRKMHELTGFNLRLRRIINKMAKLKGVSQKKELPW